MSGKRIPHVLLVDDDEDDLYLSRRVLTKAGIATVTELADGQEVIRYLDGSGGYADRERFPMPDLLLLDLKMPDVTGFAVLEWIKAQPRLNRLQVFVLTSSNEERDRDQAAQAGAAGYLVKPLSPKHLLNFRDWETPV